MFFAPFLVVHSIFQNKRFLIIFPHAWENGAAALAKVKQCEGSCANFQSCQMVLAYSEAT